MVFLAGAVGASHVSKRLTFDFSLPGQPGYESAKRIDRLYGNGAENPPAVVVVTAPQAIPSPPSRPRSPRPSPARAWPTPLTRIVDFGATHDPRFVTDDGRSTFAIVFAPLEKTLGAPKVPIAAARSWRPRCPWNAGWPDGSHAAL